MAIQPEFKSNPYSSAAAFGRMFYGLDNSILFSQVLIDDINALGRCYQRNDPTSSQISDLLATDGGEIPIQNAGRVLKIEEFLNGVICFCDKGVFYVYGQQSGFNATEYSIQKVTEFTLYSLQGSIRVGDKLFYVSESGVFLLQPNEFGELKANNITEQTINSHYEGFVTRDIVAGYSITNKQVHFVSRNLGTGLILDLRAEGWYPQQYEGIDKTFPALIRKRATLMYLNDDSGTSVHNFATRTSRTFTDFGVAYDSFLLTQPESLGQFTRKQTAINLKALMEKTETEITGYTGTEYTFDYPSSCVFQAQWDFDNSGAYSKFTTPVELYKPMQRGFIPTSFPYDFDTGESVIENRINIRGTGKAVSFKFSANEGKDLRLMGYCVEWAQSARQ